MDPKLQEQLNVLKSKQSPLSPDAAWVSATRARVLERAEADARAAGAETTNTTLDKVHQSVRMLLPSRTFLVARTFAVLVLVVGLAVSGWLTGVSAAHKSLPGDLLYGVKLASEKTQKVVAKVSGNKEKTVKLALETAERRSDEIKQIARTKPAEVPKASQRLKESLEDAKEEIKQVKEEDADKAALLAKDVTEKTEKITDNLKEVAKEVVAAEEIIPEEEAGEPVEEQTEEEKEQQEKEQQEAVDELVETVKLVTEVELDAIEVVLEVDPEEAKEIVLKKTQDILDDTVENLAEAADIQEDAKEEVVEGDEPTETPQEEVTEQAVEEGEDVEAIPEPSVESTDVLEEVTIVVEEVEKDAEEIEKGLEETKELIDSGQLQEALEKLKELSSIQGETEKSLVSARGKVEEQKKEEAQEQEEGTDIVTEPVPLPSTEVVASGTVDIVPEEKAVSSTEPVEAIGETAPIEETTTTE